MARYSELLTAGRMDDARAVLTGSMAAPRKAYFDALNGLIEFQESLAKTAQADAVAAVSTLNVSVLAFTGLALVAGAAIGFGIVRSTTAPLRRAVDAARAVAAGDLSPAHHLPRHQRNRTTAAGPAGDAAVTGASGRTGADPQ